MKLKTTQLHSYRFSVLI